MSTSTFTGTEKSEERTVSAEFACVGAPYRITECDALMFSDRLEVPYTRHWVEKADREFKNHLVKSKNSLMHYLPLE